MFSKTALFLAFTALTQLVAAAPPPACLLGAVNQYDDPSDLSAVCGSDDATSKISKLCGDAADDALKAFADICESAGVEVSSDSPKSSTKSSGASGSASATGTVPLTAAAPYGTGNATVPATGTVVLPPGASATGGPGSPGGGPTPTGGNAPESTGAAGKLEAGVVALVAGFGLLAAAL
ncbi:hypothetical protein BDV95DRAFT_594004 [Massariosphaeria phaeospora]|uniref:Extracellular membrane protein CFEM domain-containing protein n=1 Tax=Massariosphaeria phaeospora TaxID=100035 RepID=A0A7C8MA56_9PLEO|nr:hypothetical protein BDV95DRAFT_594004 [Massariosphaeria phaeospora]